MNYHLAQIAGVLLLVRGQTGAGVSSWDETQLKLLQQHSTPLRWDNVEGPPYWVSGTKPRYQFRQRLHFFHLMPGEEVVLRANANTWLRLSGEAKTLKLDDLKIEVSTDTRLFVESTPLQTIDPYSLLIELPHDKPALIRLTRSHQSKSSLVFAAYLSRMDPFDTLLPYRDTVHVPGKAVRLRRESEAASQRARALEPGEEVEFSLTGPARLQLVARLRWPRTEPRQEQSLVLQFTVDDTHSVPLLLAPELDARHRTRVDHLTELVSDRMNGFFDLPEGKHHVRIETIAPVYLSLFQQADPDFLLPSLNGPNTGPTPSLHRGAEHVSDASGMVSSPLSPPWSARDLMTQEQAAWRLARDNQPMEAGAQAADWLNRIAQSRPDYPTARQAAKSLQRHRTFYREILPTLLPAGQPLREVLFMPRHLPPLFEPEQHIAVYNPTLDQVQALLAEGQFARIPTLPSPGIPYELPARAHDSELRIATMSSSPTRTRLLVQYDEEAPFTLVLDPATVLPEEELAAADAFATLRVLEQEVRLPANVAFGHAVGALDLPLPVSQPGVIELPLPQHVRNVRIQAEAADAPVLASVAYRAARPFEFGEAGYLALLSRVDSAAAMQMLVHPQDKSGTTSELLEELHNHLLPLSRLLRAHFNDFTNGIDLASLPPRAVHPLSSKEFSTLRDSALDLERDGQLIEATEIWNRIFWDGTAADQAAAGLAIMRCLQSLGQEFLSAQYARYLLLESPSQQIPEQAVALLESVARQTNDSEQLEELRAVLFLRCPCVQHLAALTEALALNGRDEFALSAGLILPGDSRPAEPLLLAALHQDWWQTFDQLVEGLKENDVKCFWRAQRHLAFYDFVGAEQQLELSNGRGREMLQALQEGMRIREQLTAPELSERLGAVLEWEQWQSHQPGPKAWRTARDILQDSSATELLFNCEQNRFVTYLRAERSRPARLRFLGPLRMQVEARPILGVPSEEPVNDWLEVAEYGMTNRVPVLQCVPNLGLRFTTDRDALVGTKTVATLEWGPGWHDVEVGLASHTALIRVLQEQPMLPTRILPTLNPNRMNLVLNAGRESQPVQNRGHARETSDLWWVPSEQAHSKSLVDRVGMQSDGDVTKLAASLADVEKLRLALRMESEPGLPLQYDSLVFRGLPPSEQWLAASRTGHWNDFTNWAALPDFVQANRWLATGRVQELLDSEIPRNVLQRLTTLLEISELFPAWREQAQCLAESVAAGANCPPGSDRILFRLTRERTWVPLRVSPLSAGIRPVQVRADLPQNPSTRLRRALLPPAGTNQFTLSGQSVFTASMTLQRPAHVQLHAELARVGFIPLRPLSVSLQLDAQEVQHLVLEPPKTEERISLTLSEGSHQIRAWVDNPVVDHWVRIRLSGTSEELTNAFWSQSLAEVADERRFFNAATPAQPVQFSYKGPALLRVDEYREGRFISQFHLVSGGEQMVEIPPAPGRNESWYQVFVRTAGTNHVEAQVASTPRRPEEVPPPKLHLPEATAPSQVRLTDYYRLGGQEEGTWTPSVLWAHRRPFEVSTLQNAVENEFVEANVAYRKASPSETVWFKTEALGRVHRPGDLTFGLSERVEGHPETLPLEWSWVGDAFIGTTGPQQEDVQWSLHTKLEVGESFHLNRKLDLFPYAGLFARYLSLDPSTASQYDYVDQDLFTSFRDEQRWGGTLGCQLEYRPWLDTLLQGGAALMSNEDFTPDNWGVRFSWTQLVGPLRGEVAYRFRRFLDDADRSSASSLHGVSASLYAERWISGRHRIEFGVQFSHDWPDSGDSYFLVFKWDFGQGRGYQDYAPRETVFRDLRSRRIAGTFNNLLQPDPSGSNYP